MHFLEDADIPDPCAGRQVVVYDDLNVSVNVLILLIGYLLDESSLAGSLAQVLQRYAFARICLSSFSLSPTRHIAFVVYRIRNVMFK